MSIRRKIKGILPVQEKLAGDLAHLLQETREVLLRQERLLSRIEIAEVKKVLDEVLGVLARYLTEDARISHDHLNYLVLLVQRAQRMLAS